MDILNGIKGDFNKVENFSSTKNWNELTPNQNLKEYALLAKRWLENDQVYLNPSISLYLMADSMNIPAYKLSYAMTYFLGKNYIELINSYRIEHAKKLLLSPAFAFYSVDGIGNESGFGNKTTFYTAFKKHTGTTPAEFRKKFNSSLIYRSN